MTYRPARDSRRVRWFWRTQWALGAVWLAGAVTGLLLGSSPLTALYLVAALIVLGVATAGRLSHITVDEEGLHWRGFRRSSHRWEEIEAVTLESRSSRWGHQLRMEVHTSDGARHRVPSDAIQGLTESEQAAQRKEVLTTVAEHAERARVPVRSVRGRRPGTG